jgi:leucyl-tRNA synthetase
VRARVQSAPGVGEETVYALAMAEAGVQTHTEGKTVRKRIFVTDKLLNIVVS